MISFSSQSSETRLFTNIFTFRLLRTTFEMHSVIPFSTAGVADFETLNGIDLGSVIFCFQYLT